MLPTFVIGLREGVEASLVVGIVAAFLRQGGHRAALRAMWAGVGLALVLCAMVAFGLQALDEALPSQQQEALETVVAAAAVGMVTFMIVWMRRHARTLAADLRTSAAAAVAQSSAWALVAMAFFAVMREGMETAVFMLAAFQASGDSTAAGLGAVLGILVAGAIGFGIYRGGIRIDLGRFFRVTAAVLVLVAAGLVASAIHTAHEATWFNSLQATPLDLTWLVRPGTATSSLVTGVLGVQPEPTVGEMLGWALYAVPMLAYVLAPRRAPTRLIATTVVMALAVAATGCGGAKSEAGTATPQGVLHVTGHTVAAVANSKITGEEDRYSHTDLSDFQGNLQGARTAFELPAPALRRTGNRNLVHTIELRFADVERTLDIYQRPTRLGFALYSALTPKDRLAPAQEVDALAEPLSTVASKVPRS